MNLHSTPEVIAETGLTERQLYYWVEHGAVTPTVPSAGTGRYMKWSDDDVARLKAILAVVNELELFASNVRVATIEAMWDELSAKGACYIELSHLRIFVKMPEH